MSKRQLNVILYGQRIGELTVKGTLINAFEYDRAYTGPALSHSMPLTRRKTGAQIASGWFEGLLPEGHELRMAMAESHSSRDTTTMGLLSVAGLDCAGAVQLTSDTNFGERNSRLEILSDADVGKRLRASNSGDPAAGEGEHWSVAGQQGKIALHRTADTQWACALGELPTTHILKPGITRLGEREIKDQALTEHLTLTAAASLGIRSANTEFATFGGTPAVVVERYDRFGSDGRVFRLHQEDFCQALGIDPSRKYEDKGGPGVRAVAELLTSVANGVSASLPMRQQFARMVAFNYLSGSPDAHAKNFSLIILPSGEVLLAPMYDSATGLGISNEDGGQWFKKSAMKIGSQYRFGTATDNDWKAFAGELGLPEAWVTTMRHELSDGIPEAFRSAIKSTVMDVETRARIESSPMLDRLENSNRST